MPGRSSGVVVFMMTDIEGSTRLWQADRETMSQALARHDTLVRSAVEQHGGAIVKEHAAGDSAFAVFRDAAPAIAAALDVQRRVADEPWPTATPLRLRMALHAGDAEVRDGDFFGPAVNRCARLRGIAHPGQILVSRAVQALAEGLLEPGAELRSLGQHWLRDLPQPDEVYQLCHPDLPGDFPPTPSSGTAPNNLPVQLTSFIGRERDLANLQATVTLNRLVTLTGVGGAGKTRLAVEVAAALRPEFPGGVWMVDLVPLRQPEQVLQQVAHTLGVHETPNQELLATVITAIGNDRKLVILDNGEHVLHACAAVAADLLHACLGLHILATSREALNVRGEAVYAVLPLAYPDPKAQQPFPTLAATDALILFADRASASRRTFALTADNAQAVAGICARLEGNPLGIELAAAWVNVLSVDQILARLQRSFDLLRGDVVDLPERHQSLQSVVDWSYDLLDRPLQRCFAGLAVFTGGWTLDAAEHVLAGETDDVLGALSALVGKSLVIMEEGADLETRFRLLETLRSFAWKYLERSGSLPVLRQRHADVYLQFAETAEPKLAGAEQSAWLPRLQAESGNFLAALGWLRAAGDAEHGLRLAGALWRLWFMRGQLSEGRSQLAAVLALPGEDGTAIRAKALHAAGTLASLQGDYAEARPLLESALAIRRALGDEVGQSQTLTNLGNLAYEQDDYAAARRAYENAVAIFRKADSPWNTALALHNIAAVAYAQCDLAAAEAQAAESLAISRRHGFDRLVVNVLILSGLVASERGQLDAARQRFDEAYAIVDTLDDAPGLAEAHRLLGTVLFEQGHVDEAVDHLETSLKIETQVGNRLGIAKTLDSLGRVALSRGDLRMAQERQRKSIDIANAIGHKLAASEALEALGVIAIRQGRVTEGSALLNESLELRLHMQNALRVAEGIESFAVPAAAARVPDVALALVGCAAAARAALGTPLPASRAAWLDPAVRSAREMLDAEAARAAHEHGARLSTHEGIEMALRLCRDLGGAEAPAGLGRHH